MHHAKSFSIAAMLGVAMSLLLISVGHAAEFHCSVEPCRYTIKPDGTGKTAHHVIIIENEAKTESVSITCNELNGSATSATKTATQLSLTELEYKTCTVNGSPGVGPHTKCSVTIDTTGKAVLTCSVEFTFEGCVISIPAQTMTGLKYSTVGTTPNREITVSINAQATGVTATGTAAACKINPAQKLSATFTTGNFLLTGETNAGVMADAWFE